MVTDFNWGFYHFCIFSHQRESRNFIFAIFANEKFASTHKMHLCKDYCGLHFLIKYIAVSNQYLPPIAAIDFNWFTIFNFFPTKESLEIFFLQTKNLLIHEMHLLKDYYGMYFIFRCIWRWEHFCLIFALNGLSGNWHLLWSLISIEAFPIFVFFPTKENPEFSFLQFLQMKILLAHIKCIDTKITIDYIL